MKTIIRCKEEIFVHKTFMLAGIVLLLSASLFAEDRIHILQSGETIYSIAGKYGVTVEEILFINGIEDARRAQVGQKLRIPGHIWADNPAAANTAVPPMYQEHIAQKGDTLFGIARNYNTNITEIRRLNNLSANYILKVGDKIKVAQSPTPVNYNFGTTLAPKQNTPSTPAVKVFADPVLKSFDYSAKWPVSVKEGGYLSGKLSGVVLTTTRSEPAKSVATGTVISAGPYRGYGRVAIVQSPEGYLYVYAGCERLSVKAGDKIYPGTEVGRVGIDSVSGKPQLFFMVYRNNNPVDPAKAPRS